MNVNVNVNIDTARILRERGLGGSKEATHFLASEVERLSKPYVPFEDGGLIGSAVVNDDSVVYNAAYAHYQYHGEVMAGRAPKHYTGQPIDYHNDTGTRGKGWDKRMMADRGDEVRESFAHYIGGNPK